MKLLPKFALLSFGVSAIPLAIAGYSSVRISQDHLRKSIEEYEQRYAVQVAEVVTGQLGNLQATLGVESRVLDLTRSGRDMPSAETIRKFLQLVYHQNDDFSAVALLDAGGALLGQPAFQEAPRAGSAFGGHEAVRAAEVASVWRHAPLQETMAAGSGVGPVFFAGPARVPHLILAVKYQPMIEEPPKVIAAMVSMRRIAGYLATGTASDRDILLLDRDSRMVISGRSVTPSDFAAKTLPGTPAGTLPSKEFVKQYTSGERRVIGAYAAATPFRLGIVVERRLEAALSPVTKLGWATVYWMSVSGLIAAAVGGLLAKSLSGRVGALVEGARHIAQGRLDTKLEVQSDDELGDVARAFNSMATSLDAARTEILRQTDEIVAWNETLEKRVEQKTKELREAQDLLLRSRSLAALGSLGAGVAHEINNPLTGVLGLAQLLLTDLPYEHPAHAMIKDIEEQAARIQGIVANLLRLSQKQSGEDYRPLDLSRVLDDALELCSPKSLADAGITVDKRVVSPSPPVRGSGVQLQAAFIQLVLNAKNAMDSGGQLTLETSLPEAKLLCLRISDTGRGISPEHIGRIFDPFFTTKARTVDTGVGLSVVHKIIEDHGGAIRVHSEVGRGTTFWITFPIDTGASLLA